jgi:hypothetical protein
MQCIWRSIWIRQCQELTSRKHFVLQAKTLKPKVFVREKHHTRLVDIYTSFHFVTHKELVNLPCRLRATKTLSFFSNSTDTNRYSAFCRRNKFHLVFFKLSRVPRMWAICSDAGHIYVSPSVACIHRRHTTVKFYFKHRKKTSKWNIFVNSCSLQKRQVILTS